MSDQCPFCGIEAVYHPRASYALAKLCERLVAEGYVVEDRQKELLDRACNMQRGRGFLTNAEIAFTPGADPALQPETSVEDLLQ
jgi:hypothetical protein